MPSAETLLQRIAEIACPIMDGEEGTIRCNVDEEVSGIPANFIDAIWDACGPAVGEEFFLLVRDLGHSFKKEDGTFPNVVKLHFLQGGVSAELRTETYNAATDSIHSSEWKTMGPAKLK